MSWTDFAKALRPGARKFKFTVPCGEEPTTENVSVEPDPPAFFSEDHRYMIGQLSGCSFDEAELLVPGIISAWKAQHV